FTVVLDRKHDIIIDGFVFDAQLQSTYHILMTIDTPLNDTSGLCHDIEIRNNEIANAYRDSQVGSDSQGIGTGNNCTNLWIHHNIIHDIGTDLIGTSGTHVGGYAMYFHSSNSIVENNTIYNMSSYGIHMHAALNCPDYSSSLCTGMVIRNNV